MDPVVIADGVAVISPIALLADLALKTIGAVGVMTIVIYIVRMSAEWGRMTQSVQDGFKANEDAHEQLHKHIDRVQQRVEINTDRLANQERSIGGIQEALKTIVRGD